MLRGNYKVTFSYKKSGYCLASISWLNSSSKMFLGKNWKFFKFIQRLSWLSCDLFATNSFSRKLLRFNGHSCDYIATITLLPNLRKMRVFRLYVADVTCFQNTLISLALLSSNLPQPKTIFHSNPITLKFIFCISNFKVCFLNHFLHVFLRLCRN